jgi:plastocyanin
MESRRTPVERNAPMRDWLMRFSASVVAAAFVLSWQAIVAAATITVDVKNNYFEPTEVTIKTGDTVRWVVDEGVHTATSTTGLWDSDVLSAGTTFEYTFNDPGDFDYTCLLHFDCCSMAGTVHVRIRTSPLPEPTPTPFPLPPRSAAPTFGSNSRAPRDVQRGHCRATYSGIFSFLPAERLLH